MHSRQLHRLIVASRQFEYRTIKTSHQTTPSLTTSFSEIQPFLYVQLAREQHHESKLDEYFEPPQLEQKFRDNVAQMATQMPENLQQEQLETESRTLKDATEAYQKLAASLVKGGVGSELKASEKLCVSWFAPLNLKLSQAIDEILRTNNDCGKPYACVLVKVPANELACITLHETLSVLLLKQEGVPYTRLATLIGKSVEFQFNMSQFKKDESLAHGVNKMFKENIATSSKWKQQYAARQIADGEWSETLRAQIGSFLLDTLIECATLKDERTMMTIPALHIELLEVKKFGGKKGSQWKSAHTVICHPKVYEIIDQRIVKAGQLFVVNKPMVCPPQPWTKPDLGGYLSYKTKLIRTNSQRHHDLLYSADLSKIYEPLNYLGSIPWRINTRVFDVVKTLWANGGDVAGLVSNRPFPPLNLPPDISLKEKIKLEKNHLQKSRELYSLKCDTELKLQSATSYEGRRIFFPCNIDFRGRVYPLPPHLNHLGADLARGLLCFDEGRLLGKSGLRWLKIHLANMSGRDKLSFEDREQWTNENLHHVAAVSLDPLGKKSSAGLWWQSLEDPLQGLATCFELHEALKNPDTFLSHLPVHMDGSCNGLQHFGALGRDAAGGAAVNLLPSDKPQDVYNGVLIRVKEKMAKDMYSDDPDISMLATLLDGKITRKVIKQTVMTSVYGVTILGAKAQVHNRLQELDNITWPENKDVVMSRAALYIAKLALQSLGDLFSSADQIMNWLRTVAKLVTTLEQQPISWLTPLGLPVLQPYVRKNEFKVTTHHFSLSLLSESRMQAVSSIKQKSALPPNFVHSLDATHMLMTTADCATRGLHFAAVHDSFWTHAGTVDEMNESLRTQFVALYSEPILEDFRETLCMRFPSINFPPLPKRGTLDIKQVLNSKYFFA